MLNMNLQFFAHKKGVGSTKNDTAFKRVTRNNYFHAFILPYAKKNKHFFNFSVS